MKKTDLLVFLGDTTDEYRFKKHKNYHSGKVCAVFANKGEMRGLFGGGKLA